MEGTSATEKSVSLGSVENIVGQYEVFPGVVLQIKKGAAVNYATVRAAQLDALLTTSSLARDCEHSEPSRQTIDSANSLALTLAKELTHLIQIVAADARMTRESLR